MENNISNRIVVGDIDHTFEVGDRLVIAGKEFPFIGTRLADEFMFGDDTSGVSDLLHLTRSTLTTLIAYAATVKPKCKPIHTQFEGKMDSIGITHSDPRTHPSAACGPRRWKVSCLGAEWEEVVGKRFRITIEEIVEEGGNG